MYNIGEIFNPFGLVVMGVYSDGSTKEEKLFDIDFDDFDLISIGEKTITVIVDGKSTSFNVLVADPNAELIGLKITQEPFTTEYTDNEDLNLNGIIVTALFSDDTSVILHPTMWTHSGFARGVAGIQTIRVVHGIKTQFFDEFTVEVLATERTLAMNIVLDNTGRDISIFGIPQGQEEITLSWTGQPDNSGNLTIPTQIIIGTSVAGYSSYVWSIDHETNPRRPNITNQNIITLNAKDFTLERPHFITFTGTVGNDVAARRFSKTIQFVVVK